MHLPAPLNAAVGLLATAASEAKHLPDRAIELPMLAVSTALQVSLRAQQRYARLAARGDAVVNRRSIADEPPPWATFDDPLGDPFDDPAAARAGVTQAEAAQASRLVQDLFGTDTPTLNGVAVEAADVAAHPAPEVPARPQKPVTTARPETTETAVTPVTQLASANGAAPAKKAAPRKRAAGKRAAGKQTAATQAAAKQPAATQAAAKQPAAAQPAAKQPAAKQPAAKRASRTTRAKTVSRPRNTAPSRFDTVTDDDTPASDGDD